MNELPKVHITDMKTTATRHLAVRFRITGHLGRVDMHPQVKVLSTGSATLEQTGGLWVVTSWQVKGNNPYQIGN
jgi:hypothetical protein